MSQINVDSIANATADGPVYFPYGMRGDATNLIYEPKILHYDPAPLTTGVSTDTNITITFDQQIQFAGVGTIYIREGSANGSIVTSFTCGVSTEATIAGETLVINPSQPLGFNTTNYLTLPSVGIANTLGAYYKGTEAYLFKTLQRSDLFSASGGTHEFTIASAPSPTGYYKYHIFTGTGSLSLSESTIYADSFKALIIAGGGAGGDMYLQPSSLLRYGGGGGGAGGRIYQTGPEMSLSAGTYTVTIGAGGIGTTGNDTTISTPTSTLITAYGGGFGATAGPGGTFEKGGNGGSGGGGGGYSSPTTPASGTSGTGISGQGSNGGSIPSYNWVVNPTNTTRGTVAAGGGGSGGVGGNGQTTFSPPAPGTSSNYRGPGSAGPGGPGSPSPEFNSIILAPQVPSIPADSFAKIGPTGLYAGGGGGASVYGPAYNIPSPAYPSGSITKGVGGPGGGGNGVWYPSPSVSTDGAENGFAFTGGGGGGGGNPAVSQNTPSPGGGYGGNPASGGSGVFMIRYAVPAP